MPQYFVDTDDGETTVRDEEGITLDDVEAVRKLAIDTAAKIVCSQPLDAHRTAKVIVRGDRGVVGEIDLTATGSFTA